MPLIHTVCKQNTSDMLLINIEYVEIYSVTTFTCELTILCIKVSFQNMKDLLKYEPVLKQQSVPNGLGRNQMPV